MKYRRNYYKLLHVQPDAPTEIIRSSYLTLMMKLKHHPDMGGDDGNASLINQAYETLVDDEKRAQYDRERLYFDRVDFPKGLTPAGPQLAKRRIGYTGYQGENPMTTSTSRCLFCKTSHGGDGRMHAQMRCVCCGSPLNPVVNSTCLNAEQRRAVRRMAQHSRITFYTAWPQHGFRGQINDLSPMGMQIHTEEKLQEAQLIKIESDILHAVAMVVYCRSQYKCGTHCYVVGIKFFTLLFQRPLGTFLSVTA